MVIFAKYFLLRISLPKFQQVLHQPILSNFYFLPTHTLLNKGEMRVISGKSIVLAYVAMEMVNVKVLPHGVN